MHDDSSLIQHSNGCNLPYQLGYHATDGYVVSSFEGTVHNLQVIIHCYALDNWRAQKGKCRFCVSQPTALPRDYAVSLNCG